MLPENLRNTFDRFDKEFQTNLIKALITDRNFLEDILDWISPDYFISQPHATLVDLIINHYHKWYVPPSVLEIKTELLSFKDEQLVTEIKEIINEIENKEVNLEYIKNKSLEFCKNQKIRIGIEKSTAYLALEEYDKIRKVMVEATQIESKRDLGLNYEEDIKKVLETARRTTPTGFLLLDTIFDGGIGEGELAVICGGPSVGKSFSLINFAKNVMDQGKNVVYFTLEMDEKVVLKRFYSLISQVIINDLKNQVDFVVENVSKYFQKTKARLKVKQYPTKKATVQTLFTFLETIQSRENFIPNLVVVDYADLIRPVHKGEAKKRFELENVYEELRAMAVERKIPLLTASQANKEGSKSEFVSMYDMSESFAKAAVSDIVLGITRSPSGSEVDYGTCYIAKNRGAGKDGYILPIIYNTSLATIQIPAEGFNEKIKKGQIQNVAKEWYQLNGINYRAEQGVPTIGEKVAKNQVLNKYKNTKSMGDKKLALISEDQQNLKDLF